MVEKYILDFSKLIGKYCGKSEKIIIKKLPFFLLTTRVLFYQKLIYCMFYWKYLCVIQITQHAE